MKKYVLVDFRFDMQSFGMAVRRFQQENPGVLEGVVSLDQSTLANWYSQSRRGKYPYPLMSHFMQACNAMDVDPRQFFVLDE